jgi:hypothetical protein
VLRETLRWAAQEVGYLARHARRSGLVVTLKVRFRGFETHTRSRTLAVPSADDRVLFKTAWELFETGCRSEGWSGRPVRLIGLGLSGWDGDAPASSRTCSPSNPCPIRTRETIGSRQPWMRSEIASARARCSADCLASDSGERSVDTVALPAQDARHGSASEQWRTLCVDSAHRRRLLRS